MGLFCPESKGGAMVEKGKGAFFSELQEIFPAAAVHLSARKELKNKELSSTKVLKSSIYQRQKRIPVEVTPFFNTEAKE